MDDAMDEATKFADRLLDLRRKAGYSQEQLADLLGVSRQAISKWEGAQGRPEVDNVVKLSQIYRVSTDFILTGSASVPSVCETSSAPAPRELSREYRFALSALMVIAGTGSCSCWWSRSWPFFRWCLPAVRTSRDGSSGRAAARMGRRAHPGFAMRQ